MQQLLCGHYLDGRRVLVLILDKCLRGGHFLFSLLMRELRGGPIPAVERCLDVLKLRCRHLSIK